MATKTAGGTKRLRTYELYTSGPGGRITNRSIDYRHGMWIAQVRAKSVKHAYWLLANELPALHAEDDGILQIERSCGPTAWPWTWPWEMDVWPAQWATDFGPNLRMQGGGW